MEFQVALLFMKRENWAHAYSKPLDEVRVSERNSLCKQMNFEQAWCAKQIYSVIEYTLQIYFLWYNGHHLLKDNSAYWIEILETAYSVH